VRRSIVSLSIVLAAATFTPCAHASNVGFNVGVNISNTPARSAPVYVAPPTVEREPAVAYEEQRAADQEPAVEYDESPLVEQEPPEFIAPPQLGFYLAAGVPYDLFFAGNLYYFCRGNVWYASPYFNGPWAPVHYKKVPYALRRYPFERIHYYRDSYFRYYREHGDLRGYQHFRPARHGIVRDGHGWAGPAYKTPSRNNHNTWSKPVYNNPNRQDQGNQHRPAYDTPSRTDHGSATRTESYGTGRSDQRSGNNPNNNPAGGNNLNGLGRPVYNSTSRQDQSNWNRPADNAQNKTEFGSSGRLANNAKKPDKEMRNRPVQNAPSNRDHDNGATPLNNNPNGNEQEYWGRQGHDR
jgi:hypothetical protein